jgi:hypothetical protein
MLTMIGTTTASRVTGIVVVGRSQLWTAGQKWAGLALAAIVPVIAHIIWNLGVPAHLPAGTAWRRAVIVLTLGCAAVGCWWLWRTKRPEPGHPSPQSAVGL